MVVALHLLNKNRSNNYLEQLLERYPQLNSCKAEIEQAFYLLSKCYESGGKVLIAGNGGSAADADHIVGELMKGFKLNRKISNEMVAALTQVDAEFGAVLADNLQQALPAIALHNHASLNTAYTNDVDGRLVFAQQVYGHGKVEDVFLAISTSGNSENILYAAITAKAKGMTVIGLSGKNGGRLVNYTDIVIKVPEEEAYKVQELHLPIYHCLCLMLEDYFFGE